MAVYTYGSNNISFDTFRTWSNSVSAQANTSLTTAVNDFDPANTAPYQVSEFAPNTSIFYGAVFAGTGGTVSLTAPYSVGATSSFTAYSVTMVASATYPYTFHSWRTAASGGGSQLSTSGTLTLNSGTHTGVVNFYAYFTTTHVTP